MQIFYSSIPPVKRLISAFVVLVFCATAIAQPKLNFQTITNAAGLNIPVFITNAGDGSNRLFIVEKPGVIKVFNGNAVLPTPFLDINTLVTDDGEQGLLSVAFHPQYETNRYFFVYYNNTSGAITIARYRATTEDPNIADPASGQVLMTITKPETNHNGGTMNFGNDGMLYFATGDGGGGGDPNNNAQNGNSLLGKIIRINASGAEAGPLYTIPADNPFVTDPGVRDEIWALGLRNPFRWSFDRVTHAMWIGDVGQSAREEINYQPGTSTGGMNYGWRCYEGTLPYNTGGCLGASNYTEPIFDYDRSAATGGTSVIGGMVYRGSDYPSLYGYYIFIDFYSSNGWLINTNDPNPENWTTTLQPTLPTGIGAFGEDEDGEMYAIALDGTLFSVSVAAIVPVRLIDWKAESKNDNVTLTWQTSYEQNIQRFELEYSVDGLRFGRLNTILPKNVSTGAIYSYNHKLTAPVEFYRLKTVDADGSVQYSKVISVSGRPVTGNYIWPTVIETRSLNLQLEDGFDNLFIYAMDGKQVFQYYIGEEKGRIPVSIPELTTGTYIATLIGKNKKVSQKIIVR